jgi:hypothetical protein
MLDAAWEGYVIRADAWMILAIMYNVRRDRDVVMENAWETL